MHFWPLIFVKSTVRQPQACPGPRRRVSNGIFDFYSSHLCVKSMEIGRWWASDDLISQTNLLNLAMLAKQNTHQVGEHPPVVVKSTVELWSPRSKSFYHCAFCQFKIWRRFLLTKTRLIVSWLRRRDATIRGRRMCVLHVPNWRHFRSSLFIRNAQDSSVVALQ